MYATLWLSSLAALALVASLRRPGWSVAVARALWPLFFPVVALAGAGILGFAIDHTARHWLAAGALDAVLPLLAPVAAWFVGPTLPHDLVAALPLAALLVLDAARPGALTLATGRSVGRGLLALAASAAVPMLSLLPLVWGWADVLAATAGEPGRRAYAAAAAAGVPLSGPLTFGPDARLPAFAWWLAACLLALQAAPRRGASAGSLWLSLPLAAGLLAYAARPAALDLGVTAFAGVGLLLAAAAAGGSPRRWRLALPTVERWAVFGVAALALTVRWWGWDEPLASDAQGYLQAAREFHQRAALAGINPIAHAYLGIHDAGREPLFLVVVRLVFDLLGDSVTHLRYVSIFAALGAVVVSYRFGRATLGPAAGLGAALLLAAESWHVLGSHQGLREEAAAVFVYGLATLVVLRRRGGVGTALAAGLLAAAAILTRFDSAAVVVFLLLWWTSGLRPDWRHGYLAWAIPSVLLLPLFVGYAQKFGDPFAPVGSELGGDIQALVVPLFRFEYTGGEVLRALASGTVRIYADTVFNSSIYNLRLLMGDAAGAVIVGGFLAGSLYLLVRGPRLPAVLSWLGTYLPPFAFVAGIVTDGGPYSNRYTYLVLPAAYAVLAWTGTRPLGLLAGRLVLMAEARHRGRGWQVWRGWRRVAPLPAPGAGSASANTGGG